MKRSKEISHSFFALSLAVLFTVAAWQFYWADIGQSGAAATGFEPVPTLRVLIGDESGDGGSSSEVGLSTFDIYRAVMRASSGASAGTADPVERLLLSQLAVDSVTTVAPTRSTATAMSGRIHVHFAVLTEGACGGGRQGVASNYAVVVRDVVAPVARHLHMLQTQGDEVGGTIVVSTSSAHIPLGGMEMSLPCDEASCCAPLLFGERAGETRSLLSQQVSGGNDTTNTDAAFLVAMRRSKKPQTSRSIAAADVASAIRARLRDIGALDDQLDSDDCLPGTPTTANTGPCRMVRIILYEPRARTELVKATVTPDTAASSWHPLREGNVMDFSDVSGGVGESEVSVVILPKGRAAVRMHRVVAALRHHLGLAPKPSLLSDTGMAEPGAVAVSAVEWRALSLNVMLEQYRSLCAGVHVLHELLLPGQGAGGSELAALVPPLGRSRARTAYIEVVHGLRQLYSASTPGHSSTGVGTLTDMARLLRRLHYTVQSELLSGVGPGAGPDANVVTESSVVAAATAASAIFNAEHKVALYAPYWVPLVYPVLIGIVALLKRRKASQQAAAEPQPGATCS